MRKKFVLIAVMGLLILPNLQGCFPVVAAGAGVGVSAVVDRRSLGIQTEDENIELKAMTRAGELIDKQAHLNFTSFNLKVLVTGEVPNAEARAEVDRMVLAIPNVKRVYNETTIGPASSLMNRSNDSYVTTKVKSRSLDLAKFNPLHVKVVTEAGIVYLMGMVTEQESKAAIQVARTTTGVRKVVNLFEIISPTKAKELEANAGQNTSETPQTTQGN